VKRKDEEGKEEGGKKEEVGRGLTGG